MPGLARLGNRAVTDAGIGPDLAPLAEVFDLHFFDAPDSPVVLCAALPSSEARRRWPDLPFAARPESGRIASGRGLSRETAARSALGEAAELLSVSAWGDEATLSGLGPDFERIIDPVAHLGLSTLQDSSREDWNAMWGDVDFWPGRPTDGVRDWVMGRNARDGGAIWASADLVFVGRGEDEINKAVGSAGCASGTNLDRAAVAAMFELIESDAIGRWWFGDARPFQPPLDPSEAGPLAEILRRRGRKTRLLALPACADIPCVAAMSHGSAGGDVALGFAARATIEEAARAAAMELADGEFRLRMAANVDPRAPIHRWRASIAADDVRFEPGDASPPEFASPRSGADGVADLLASHGVQVSLFDLSRENVGPPVIRAVAPALTTQKARFRILPRGDQDLPRLLGRRAPFPNRAPIPLLV